MASITTSDLIEIEALGGAESFEGFFAGPLAMIAARDGPFLFPCELLDHEQATPGDGMTCGS